MQVKMRHIHPVLWRKESCSPPAHNALVGVICRYVVVSADYRSCVVTVGGLDGIVRRQAETDGRMEVVRLPRGAERALKSRGRKRPRVAADGILSVYRVGGLGVWIVGALRPFSYSACEIVNTPW